MPETKLAAQLYTVRDFTKTVEDLATTFQKVRAMGYTAVQLSAIGPIPPEQVRDLLQQAGLTVCNTHVGFDRLQNDLPAVVAEHRLWDTRHVAVGSLPGSYRSEGADGFRRFARDADAVGQKLRDAGLTFSYHNHAFEFQRFPGTKGTALDLIFEESEPANLQAEVDTYWVQYGGADPAAWIRKLRGRMPVVHLKDMVMQGNQQIMAEVGEGNLNWPAILDACKDAGVEWYAVEQDRCQGDPFESLAISYRNLARWGLA